MTKKDEDRLQLYTTIAFFVSFVTAGVSNGTLNTVALTVVACSLAVMIIIFKEERE